MVIFAGVVKVTEVDGVSIWWTWGAAIVNLPGGFLSGDGFFSDRNPFDRVYFQTITLFIRVFVNRTVTLIDLDRKMGRL